MFVVCNVQRRKDIRTLKHSVPPGTAVGTGNKEATDRVVAKANREWEETAARRHCLAKLLHRVVDPALRLVGQVPSETVLWARIQATTEEIQQLQQEEYAAAAIYVTFETEQGQRTALEALDASKIEVCTNNPIHLDAGVLFRGRVLRVVELTEPTAVRWTDLNYGPMSVFLQQLVTLIITCGLVAVSARVLFLCRLRVDLVLFAIILTTSECSSGAILCVTPWIEGA